MTWISIAFLPPFLYAISNIIDRVLLEKKIRHPFVSFWILCSVGFILSLGILVMEKNNIPSWPIVLQSFGVGLVLGGAFAIYFIVLQREEASRVINLIYLFPLITFLGEHYVLHTFFSPLQIIGIFLTILGALLTIMKPQEKTTMAIPVLLWLFLFILLNGGVRTYEKFLLPDIDATTLVAIEFMGIGFLGIILFLWHHAARQEWDNLWKKQKKVVGAAITSEIIGYTADILFIIAATFAPITLVSVISTSQVVFVLLLTIAFSVLFPKILQEAFDPKTLLLKGVSTLCIVGGIILITI
jgi:uncharacterized membrane protein